MSNWQYKFGQYKFGQCKEMPLPFDWPEDSPSPRGLRRLDDWMTQETADFETLMFRPEYLGAGSYGTIIQLPDDVKAKHGYPDDAIGKYSRSGIELGFAERLMGTPIECFPRVYDTREVQKEVEDTYDTLPGQEDVSDMGIFMIIKEDIDILSKPEQSAFSNFDYHDYYWRFRSAAEVNDYSIKGWLRYLGRHSELLPKFGELAKGYYKLNLMLDAADYEVTDLVAGGNVGYRHGTNVLVVADFGEVKKIR